MLALRSGDISRKLCILSLLTGLLFFPFMVVASFAPPPTFDCVLTSQKGEQIKLEIEQTYKGKLIWRQDGMSREAIFLDSVFSHGPAQGVAIGWLDGSIRTLIIHRRYAKPFPKGFDVNNPPANMSVQGFDGNGVSFVRAYLGFCSVSK